MKKFITSFRIDSIVDVITNSSSEIFVGKTKHSLEFVKQYLQDILDDYNQKNNSAINFSNAFGEIYFITEDNLDEFVKQYVFGWGFIPDGIKVEHYTASWKRHDHREVILKDGSKMKESSFYERCRSLSGKEKEDFENNRDHVAEKQAEEEYDNTWKKRNMPALKEGLVGRVCILSESDNTIPYDLFDQIENTFDASRQHLG